MPQPSPRISVALATHNGERYVGEQIRSILAQTRAVDEIVLSDDASRDRTVAIVEDAVAAHRLAHGSAPELVILRNDPPLRVTKNFEQALTRATGDLIALCDQDDVWHPERIARLAARFDDPDALLVFSNARQVDAVGVPIGQDLFDAFALNGLERSHVSRGEFFRQFMRRNLVTGATALVRRSLVTAAVPFPQAWLHDEWLAIIAAAYDGARKCDASLTDYRLHGGNQVGMRRLTLRGRFGMFAEPRTPRDRRLHARARALAERIDTIQGPDGRGPVPAEYQAMAREKLRFEEARQAYPEARILRLIPILRQLRLGRYTVYGTGLKDAVRNLLQPV